MPKPLTAKAEQKLRTHEVILDSAARLVRERGIAGAGVAEVMAGARLTVGGFYAHFKSKKALIDAALRRAAEEMRAALVVGLEDKPPAERMEIILKRYLSAAHRDQVGIGCPFPAVVGEVASSAPEHRAAIAEHLGAAVAGLETHLPAEGAIRRRHLALALVALMYGGLSLARALRGTEISDEVLKACRALGISAVKAVSP